MALADPHKLVDLGRVFSIPAMQKAWKASVRQGLRRQAIADLHDYLDIHRNLPSILPRVRVDILAGTYRPREPEVVSVEKKHGVARRLVIPSPIDAIVLQALVDAIEPRVRQRQHSKQAFYSRSHDAPSIEEFEGTFGYPWWLLWPKFQLEIWRFARACPYTVVTDVANYFDTIPLEKLRNSIATLDAFEESVLDFLFFLLESFVWRPDYIPHSGVGLPQINFDAPRLLSYAYLFPADALLENETGSNFVRWMDDIDFGVDSIPAARRVLSRLDNLLTSLGTRLNLAKTQVLSQQQATDHFWINENLYLNAAVNIAKTGKSSSARSLLVRSARRRFDVFRAAPQIGVAEKIWKRYLTLFAYLKDPHLEPHVPALLRTQPALRDAATRYYHRLGPSASRISDLLEFLESGHAVDDASVFDACQLLVEWEIAPNDPSLERLLATIRTHVASADARPAELSAGLWVLMKYGSFREVERFVWKSRDVWSRSQWAARQVAACFGVMSTRARVFVRSTVIRAGLLDALQVITHTEQLESRQTLDDQLRKYLFHPPAPGFAYPLQKILLAGTLMRGALSPSGKQLVKSKLLAILSDPAYVQWISGLHA